MKEINEDNIEVLGKDVRPKTTRKHLAWMRYIIFAVIIVVTLLLLWVTFPPIIIENWYPRKPHGGGDVYYYDKISPTKYEDANCIADMTQPSCRASESIDLSDTINDVSFTIYFLDNLKGEVSFTRPNADDPSVKFALPAADYRADNGEIVGDFIIDKKRIAHGSRKEGWCYVSPEGDITLGIGSPDAYIEKAEKNGGCFFRQYALVYDSEPRSNRLKGKAVRRAIGKYQGRDAIVVTTNRESLYDFSEALADYGFNQALYLPGGNAYMLRNQGVKPLVSNDYDAPSPHANYLIFKSK